MSMDNNNNEFEQAFYQFKQHSQLSCVSEDFENRVFIKIKKKKNQRKVVASVTLGILIFSFLSIAGVILFHRETGPIIMARPGTTDKEEVPVTEDVIFASYDSRTNYATEQVAYHKENEVL